MNAPIYNIIGIGFFVSIQLVFLGIALHDIGIRLRSFIFDTPYDDYYEKYYAYKISSCGDKEEFWFFYWFIGGGIGGAFASMVWPISLTGVVVYTIALSLRSVVRASKRSLEQHVKELHKEN